MGKEKPKEIEEKVRSYLGLNHRLVGIKISEEKKESPMFRSSAVGPGSWGALRPTRLS
jgi:hypothetical protein